MARGKGGGGANGSSGIQGVTTGQASTYATLPTLRLDGEVLQNCDLAILDTDDIGTGTAQNPQYPKGVYKYNGTQWVASLTYVDDIQHYHLPRANDTAGVSPTLLEAPGVVNGNTAVVFLTDGVEEYWTYTSGAWALVHTSTPVQVDGNLEFVSRANDTTGVEPTALDVPNPVDGDVAKVFLNDGTREYRSHDGTNWTLVQTIVDRDAGFLAIVNNETELNALNPIAKDWIKVPADFTVGGLITFNAGKYYYTGTGRQVLELVVSSDANQELTIGSDGLPYYSTCVNTVLSDVTTPLVQNIGTGQRPINGQYTFMTGDATEYTLDLSIATYSGSTGAFLVIGTTSSPDFGSNDLFTSGGDRMTTADNTKQFTVTLPANTLVYVTPSCGGSSSATDFNVKISACVESEIVTENTPSKVCLTGSPDLYLQMDGTYNDVLDGSGTTTSVENAVTAGYKPCASGISSDSGNQLSIGSDGLPFLGASDSCFEYDFSNTTVGETPDGISIGTGDWNLHTDGESIRPVLDGANVAHADLLSLGEHGNKEFVFELQASGRVQFSMAQVGSAVDGFGRANDRIEIGLLGGTDVRYRSYAGTFTQVTNNAYSFNDNVKRKFRFRVNKDGTNVNTTFEFDNAGTWEEVFNEQALQSDYPNDFYVSVTGGAGVNNANVFISNIEGGSCNDSAIVLTSLDNSVKITENPVGTFDLSVISNCPYSVSGSEAGDFSSVATWDGNQDFVKEMFYVTDDPASTTPITEIEILDGQTKTLYLLGQQYFPSTSSFGGATIGHKYDVTNTSGVLTAVVLERDYILGTVYSTVSYNDLNVGPFPGTGNSSISTTQLNNYLTPDCNNGIEWFDKCYEKSATTPYTLGSQSNYLDEIKANQLATLSAGPHVRWTAPQDTTLTALRLARLGGAVSTSISWSTSTGESGSDTQLGAGFKDMDLGSIELKAGDTIDFTLDSIPGGQMQLGTPSLNIANGWTSLQSYAGFASTSFWTTLLIGFEGVSEELTIRRYEDDSLAILDKDTNTLAPTNQAFVDTLTPCGDGNTSTPTIIDHTSTEQVVRQVNGQDVYSITFTGTSLAVGTTVIGNIGTGHSYEYPVTQGYFMVSSNNTPREFSTTATGANAHTISINYTTGAVSAIIGSNWGGVVGDYEVTLEYIK